MSFCQMIDYDFEHKTIYQHCLEKYFLQILFNSENHFACYGFRHLDETTANYNIIVVNF